MASAAIRLTPHRSAIAASISSPPRCVSPLVASTSKTRPAKLQHGNVKGSAAQIIDRYLRVFGQAVQAVSKRCRRRLRQEPFDHEPRGFAGSLGGGALSVVEISGHSNDGAVNQRSQAIVPRHALVFVELLRRHPRAKQSCRRRATEQVHLALQRPFQWFRFRRSLRPINRFTEKIASSYCKAS